MKVLVFPRADKNPYQRLLYGAMTTRKPVAVTYIENTRSTLLFLPIYLLVQRSRGYSVLHLHWPSFYVSPQYRHAKLISYLLSNYCLFAIRISGLRLVWTIHNCVPHEPETLNDKAIAQRLARLARRKIIHSKYVVEEMHSYGMDTDRTVVVPHGNYKGVYPVTQSQAEARTALQLEATDFVLLFFGMVRQYKGIENLLAAYQQINAPHTRLLIVGKSDDEALTMQIKAAAKDGKINAHLQFVPDTEVATYFQAADVVALPFNTITTSGSALLAITFSKPLIAPRSGALLDIPSAAGYFYDAADPVGLSQALKSCYADTAGRLTKQKAASDYAKTLNWDTIAEATYDVYTAALGKRP